MFRTIILPALLVLMFSLSPAQAATATIRPAFAHFFDSLDQAQQVRFAPMN